MTDLGELQRQYAENLKRRLGEDTFYILAAERQRLQREYLRNGYTIPLDTF